MNLPNKLTVLRICMVPLFVLCMYLPISSKYIIAMIIFALASITDMLDGKIARARNLVTDFGKFMDPLTSMIEVNLVPAWIVIIIVARELAVSIMRAIAAAEGKVIAAGSSGKLKTVTQMFAIIFLLLGAHMGPGVFKTIGGVLIYIAAILTLYSGYEYFYANRKLFSDM